MSNPWFRMYSEFSHDPKVQMLSEAMQRRYIMVMCLRCSNDLVTLHETEIAFHLRISNEDLVETKALFISKGFIDAKWNLLNWEKRQFASDTSKERVAKHRALQKEKQSVAGNGNVALLKRNDNALDTDTDTDTDKKKTPDGFDSFWKTYPKKTAKPAALKAFKSAKINGHLPDVLAHVGVMSASDDWTKNSGQFVPNPATYLNQRRWEDEAAPATAQRESFV